MKVIQESKRKRRIDRIKISNLNDLNELLRKEGYIIDEANEEKTKGKIINEFNVDKSVVEDLYKRIKEDEVDFRVEDIRDLINYIEKITLFENLHKKLSKKVSRIKTLIIDRIEYEREPSIQEDVENMISIIEKVADEVSDVISREDRIKIEELEREIDSGYVYAKDIELLKKMLINNRENVKETYNEETKTKTIYIKIPKEINYEYIKAKIGTTKYHEYLTKNIPRMSRLIKNMNKYIKEEEKSKDIFRINQSEVLQDSINMAVAVYDNKEFKAISGSDEIENCCKALPLKETVFKSNKVNKLGKLGIGYDRVNDSEKKIFEEIHKQIEKESLRDKGDLTLYSKWEPCPSCYLVINQFRKIHPGINVKVKYIKRYGE